MAAPIRSVGSSVVALKDLVPAIDAGRLFAALEYARELYGDRLFPVLKGVTFFDHVLQSAELLAEFCRDDDAIIACILQHVPSVADRVPPELERRFGRSVRGIVSRIHLLSHLFTGHWKKSFEEMKTMLVSVSDDARILLIALAVACVLMQRQRDLEAVFRLRLSRQALHLFAPIAARLGIYALKYRLERYAFPECYPVDAEKIDVELQHLRREYGDFLMRTASAVRDFLRRERVNAEVLWREKQPYSIFRKMQEKGLSSAAKITDLFAIRVIVDSVQDCYQSLGLLHRLATPLAHRFKDFISFPKPNGYQSLHTSLIALPHTPKDVVVEVQIRTRDMHSEAEYGIAAHWLYKERGDHAAKRVVQSFRFPTKLLRDAPKEKGRGTTLDHDDGLGVAIEDRIYVLTPRGDFVELPDGATPLDFAFAIHTDLGLKFKSARVNGHIASIASTLENGDVVEVATHKEPRPAFQWMEQLKTSSARAKLKAYFFAHNRSQFLQKGREMLNAELRTRKLKHLDNDLSLLSTFDGNNLAVREREDLLVKIGMGSVRTSSILRHASLTELPCKQQKKSAASPAPPNRKRSEQVVEVIGQKLDLPFRFARCCAPLTASPRPEKIVGVVTRAGVINVHRDGCGMTKDVNPERRVRVRWVL